jgi:alkylhydroperoxidase/carboxymuconolactone decarboxylase family protein YurZ
MLQGHLNISLNVGLSPKQLQEFIMIMESTAGIEKSKTAKIILDRVLENR